MKTLTKNEIKNYFKTKENTIFKNNIELFENMKKDLNKDLIKSNIVVNSFIKEGYLLREKNKLIVIHEKKLLIPEISNNSKFQDLVKKIILNMLSNQKGKLLLVGNPGVGKTTIIKTIMQLLRKKLIIIEAPHTNEDKIISLPYLVKNGNKEENKKINITDNEFSVVNAESCLITDLKEKSSVSDLEYNTFLEKNKIYLPFIQEFEKGIKAIEKYDTILFIDEFYRTNSVRMQNLFRTILNGYIGTTKIPENVYVIYASNTDNVDGSLDEIPSNHQFEKVIFDNPDTVDFFRYIASNFKEDLNIDVYNAFVKNITKEDLGQKDSNEIRISPRRWEEIIKLLSASLPITNITEGRALMSIIKENFNDYEISKLQKSFFKFDKIIKNLVADNSNISIDNLLPFSTKDWQEVLDLEINLKMKMGENRKYIPIISGTPGIGKTEIIRKIAKNKNLKLIEIDAGTLNNDDTIGLTTPKNINNIITTKFTMPPLYQLILNQYDETLIDKTNEKYTHLLFIDELSRTKPQVFNILRALLLDKKIGSYSLPKDIMIVSAMNPFDTGTNVLTNHMKDVVDIISAEANFLKVIDFLKNKDIVKKVNKFFNTDITTPLFNNMINLTKLLESDTDIEDNKISDLNKRKFYWTDGMNVIYISAREMDDILIGSLNDLYNSYTLLGKSFDYRAKPEKLKEFVNDYADIVANKFENFLSFIVEEKYKLEKNTTDIFMKAVQTSLINFSKEVFENLNSIKSELEINIIDVFKKAGSCQNLLKDPDIDLIMERVSDNDVDIIIYNFNEIVSILLEEHNIDSNTNPSITVSLIEELVNLYKIATKLKENEMSSEVLQGLSDAIIERGFKVITNKIIENDINFLFKNLSQDIKDNIMIISNKYKENKNSLV